MRLFIITVLSLFSIFIQAQQRLTLRVTEAEGNIPVIGSFTITGLGKGFSTDTLGFTSVFFPANGSYTLVASAVGYAEKQITIAVPHRSDTLVITLESEAAEMEEVIVQSTRTSRTIANVPTRVEVIEFEEIDEKNNMRPGNVAMLLHESTGIQVQQTSATSANASIRIQGLDGRYTQLLKDGFPNFGNFSSGLSVLEIPPLDLKQVEIIKGPASPLFGGGAIAGVVNFISKTPDSKPEHRFILNQSNIGQSNIGAFTSGRGKKAGYTLLGLYNRQKEYDVDEDDFTEVPRSQEFTIHPKLFFYPDEKTTITIGNSTTKTSRTGGDIQAINKNFSAEHQYFEKNQTTRNISTLELEKKTGELKKLIFKQSFSIFDRRITLPSITFAGIDYNAYTELSYVVATGNSSLVFGGNYIYNNFREKAPGNANRNNKVNTGGLYGQHTWDLNALLKLESGLRIDHVRYRNSIYSKAETFVLPRISLLVKYNPQWSSRIGGGMGYKAPTLFTEETETIQYRDVSQLNEVRSEKSYGGTADVNFTANSTGPLAFTLNHMFFYTRIDKPLVLRTSASGLRNFSNATQPVTSKGFETNARFVYNDNVKLFLGYTFNDSKAKYRMGNQFLRLVPRHKLNTALIYEKEGLLKLGLEGYFTGRQYLTNGMSTPAFSEFGFMGEKIFKHFSLYVNFENFTDTRQSRYKNVVNGSHLDPSFDEIWTHTEGFVVNGGIKIRF
jgi:iron complex outermembrane receptor protein/outer membrane receptor for ferrienterochelin and colicins